VKARPAKELGVRKIVQFSLKVQSNFDGKSWLGIKKCSLEFTPKSQNRECTPIGSNEDMGAN